MKSAVVLHGYRFSTYTRTVRLALLSKGVTHAYAEVDPFAELSDTYARMHPFGRVPLLQHGTFEIFETAVITRYIDRAFVGRALQPDHVADLARMDQVIAVVDAYAYWPMVRQVASHGFSRPFFGEEFRLEDVEVGIKASHHVLTFLNRVAEEGAVLSGRMFTLADCHLAPVMDYFLRTAEGKLALSDYAALSDWWNALSATEHLRTTDPFARENH